MAEKIPEDIREDLEKASILHQRASSDYEKCQQFNKLMSDILGRLEDAVQLPFEALPSVERNPRAETAQENKS